MTEEEVYRDLGHAIIIQAVVDWRYLCKKMIEKNTVIERINQHSFDTIRIFFESEWCTLLCGKLDPAQILARLEKERKTAIKRITTGGTANG